MSTTSANNSTVSAQRFDYTLTRVRVESNTRYMPPQRVSDNRLNASWFSRSIDESMPQARNHAMESLASINGEFESEHLIGNPQTFVTLDSLKSALRNIAESHIDASRIGKTQRGSTDLFVSYAPHDTLRDMVKNQRESLARIRWSLPLSRIVARDIASDNPSKRRVLVATIYHSEIVGLPRNKIIWSRLNPAHYPTIRVQQWQERIYLEVIAVKNVRNESESDYHADAVIVRNIQTGNTIRRVYLDSHNHVLKFERKAQANHLGAIAAKSLHLESSGKTFARLSVTRVYPIIDETLPAYIGKRKF